VHHCVAGYLKLAPHRAGGAGKGCHRVTAQPTAASSESDEDQEDGDNVNCDNAEPHSDMSDVESE